MNLRFETNSLGDFPTPNLVTRVSRRVVQVDASLRPAFLAYGPAEKNVERLFEDGALCVTSGQQPGLLTGPLYTVYKALSAAALARQLESQWDRPVIPVFWVAGDDHDFAEANHCFFPSGSSDVIRAVLRDRDAAAKLTPMYRESVGNDIEAVFQDLLAATRETEFRAGVFEWVKTHYRPDNDLASAFGGALAELLSRFGVVVFSPTHVRAKQSTARWIVAALEHAGDLDRLLQTHAEQLVSQGEPAPIAVGDSASTVLVESTLGRDRLLIEGSGFRTRRANESWSLAALEELAENDPERLSPNVLLRPVVEAALLPTVVYVAGPGEMAYLPQAAPLYRALQIEPQAAVPRWSGWIVENRSAKIFDKYGVGVADFDLPEGKLEARILHGRMPDEAADALRRLAEALEVQYKRLAESAGQVDLALEKAALAAERGALRDLAGVEKKIVKKLKELNETTVRQVASARTSFFPLGKPQERIFNVVPYLISYGGEFLDQAYDCCREWAAGLETAAGEA